MKKTLKRTLAIIMVVLMVMMSAPISGLISADLSDSIGSNIRVKAATEYTLYWPVPTSSATIGRISSAFGPRKSPTSGASSNHRGVDIPVASGTPVYAVYDGVVVAVGKTSARGNYVVLYHSSIGLSTLYQHLTRAIVQKGSSVSGGSQIALSGNTGIGTGAHLHYGVMVGKATKVDNDQPSYNMAINPLGTNITYYSVGKENISDTNISLFDYNATFIVKASSKAAKSGPLSSYDTTRTLSKGTKINVKAYCYNEYGNLWYKTDKGDYIYENYLEADSYESLPPSNYNPSKYKVICSSKNIKNDPVGSSDTIGTVKQNQEVSVIGYLYNEYGNLWYELEDGGFLAHNYLSVVSTEKTSPSNYLNESMIVRASSKTARRDPYGEADELRTLTSNTSVQIHGYVYNQYGNLWYMTADEDYLYSSYLEPASTNSAAPSRYFYQEFYANNDKVEKDGPYDVSETINNISSGSKIATIGYVINLFGNKWYETVDGNFVYNSNLTCAHSYSSTITTAPTCTQAGVKTFTCSKCGDKYTETIAKKGHTEVTVTGKAATCTATGLTDGKKCSVCGTVTVAQQTIAKKGHTEVTVAGKAATCTATGLTDGKKCSVCGTVTVAQQTIAKKGHTEITVKGKAATCTATGLTDGKKCSVCGTVTVAQKTIAKKAHTEVVDKAVSATCTKTGLTEGKHCSVCNTVIVAQTVVPVKNHSYSSWKQTKAPTCTSAGEKQRTCSSCGKTEKQAVAIIDHTYTTEIIEPTCSENGERIYICSECRYSYNEDIPATGHADKNSDGACDDCSEVMTDKSEKCSCLCHKSGFMGFIWKILRIFYKLFKANPVCNCGVKHY